MGGADEAPAIPLVIGFIEKIMSLIRANLQAVLQRIQAACAAAGRPCDTVRLLAVSKTWPAEDIAEAYDAGQRAFGECQEQEAAGKLAALADLPIEWHFVGPIQSNKTRPIAEHFAWVHSVDRERIARRLSEQRPAAMPPLMVCVQVNISGEGSKSGVEPEATLALARMVAALPRLRLRGLMSVPAPSTDSAVQRAQFRRLKALYDEVRAAGIALDTLSMGMSDDLEAAISEGATIVRIGTAIFGRRAPAAATP
jgi:pyridoxal phosphate enzyme (YggS family)